MERLIDKENAINDLVSANKHGGMRIMHEFEKAREEEIQLFRKNTDDIKRRVDLMIKEEMGELKKFSEDRMKKTTRVAELEKEWEDQQRSMWAKLEDLLPIPTD